MTDKKTKILIIDDVPENIYLLQEMLDQNEFETITANNGKEGIRTALNEMPGLIICDIMMPELSGYDVMKILRQNPKTETIPFIFLSAKTSQEEIRQGMNLGADDYLTKPFGNKELVARVEALLRRVKHRIKPALEHCGLKIDEKSMVATLDGKILPLTRMEMNILIILMRKVGSLVSYSAFRSALEEDPTGARIISVEILHTHIKNIRHKLGNKADMIESIRAEGYRLVDFPKKASK